VRALDICRMTADAYDMHGFPKGTLFMLVQRGQEDIDDGYERDSASPPSYETWAVASIGKNPRYLAWVWTGEMEYVTSVSELVEVGS
jgi:hypothetical protein